MKYGKLETIFPPNMQVSISASPAVRKLISVLSKLTDGDYLLLSGDPVLIGLAVAVATDQNRGRVNLLKWDNHEHDYFPVEVNLYG